MLRIDNVDVEILEHLREKLEVVFKDLFSEVRIINEILKIPENSFDPKRNQYLSPLFLHAVRNYAEENKFNKILGITPLDLFVYELNYVFGQAEFGSHAKAAIISLFRLFPEFYRQSPNREVFLQRMVKEGVHEIGHTLGLEHCQSDCIMVFSNSIIDTDKKPPAFCKKCWSKILK